MSGSLVLDAGGILKLAAGDAWAWARVAVLRDAGWKAVIPTPVVAQVHRGGTRGRSVDGVLAGVGITLPTSEPVARLAGELLGVSARSDAIDAIVAAEALSAQPAAILTSDPGDLARLLEAGGERPRVMVIGV
jgi:hypothetical protein